MRLNTWPLASKPWCLPKGRGTQFFCSNASKRLFIAHVKVTYILAIDRKPENSPLLVSPNGGNGFRQYRVLVAGFPILDIQALCAHNLSDMFCAHKVFWHILCALSNSGVFCALTTTKKRFAQLEIFARTHLGFWLDIYVCI
jgi:hypothetical protein